MNLAGYYDGTANDTQIILNVIHQILVYKVL